MNFASIDEPPQVKGRPRLPLSDESLQYGVQGLFHIVGPQLIRDLADAQAKGCIRKVPHFNSIVNYPDHHEMYLILSGLITRSSIVLAALEEDLAPDSTGFMNWSSEAYGDGDDGHDRVNTRALRGDDQCQKSSSLRRVGMLLAQSQVSTKATAEEVAQM